MGLLINWFRLEFDPSSFRLPVVGFPNYEASSDALATGTFRALDYHRQRATPSGQVRVVLLNGPQRDPRWEHEQFSLSDDEYLTAALVSRSLAGYFRSKAARA